MDNNFKEIIKQLNYEEWRQQKIRKRHEILIDPHAPIWNYIDNYGIYHNNEKRFFTLSCDEILREIEKCQNIIFVTIKRRRKVDVSSQEWCNFTKKIENMNNRIEKLNNMINNLYKRGDQEQ